MISVNVANDLITVKFIASIVRKVDCKTVGRDRRREAPNFRIFRIFSPLTPVGRVRREKPTVAFPYNEFDLSRGLETVWIMPPRCQTMSVSYLIFIDNSTHMLNLILSMISFRAKNNSDRS